MTPSYSDMARVFGHIGVMSFGGPAAQIALMHKELVEDRPWLDEQTYLRALSLCMLLPGPEAMQLATYSGWKLRGVGGGLLAGGLFVLPGAFVIAILVGLYAQFGDLPLVQSMFLGIKAAVIVIVLQALRNLSRKALKGRSSWILAGLGFLAIFALNLPFPLIIAAAAIWGYATAQPGETPPLSQVDSGATLRTSLIWGGLWLLPLVALTLTEQTLLADLGWFFAKLAVVTFGGAYAVLAYMTQTIVDQYGWIGTDQMIDALGLAETTPGPLILVTQFVAMLTGQLQGGATLAIAAGIVALWATFVPCFLWIFLAAPYLDHISARPRLAAALQAITATVVGIILNLSVWFALHVLFADVGQSTWGVLSFPMPDWSTIDVTAGIFCLVAAVWIWGFKRGLGETLILMAALGAAVHLL
ncbi:chromate efflux transporter [Falsiruegeria mediterranea]